MNVDRFDLELKAVAEAHSSPETRAHKRANFVSFLRAGGIFSWADWIAMSDETSLLAEEAGREVRLDELNAQAELIAQALRAPQDVAGPPAPKEDAEGDRIRSALVAATTNAAERLPA